MADDAGPSKADKLKESAGKSMKNLKEKASISDDKKAEMKQTAAQAKEMAGAGAMSSGHEFSKKMGYFGRMMKGKKLGTVELPEDEMRRREDFMQPLLDGLKRAKNHYIEVDEAVTSTISDVQLAAASLIDTALAVGNKELLVGSPIFNSLPMFVAGQSKVASIDKDFVETMRAMMQASAQRGKQKVDGARKKKEDYYSKRLHHDECLVKVQATKKHLASEEDEAKRGKLSTTFRDQSTVLQTAETEYKQVEGELANLIKEVLDEKAHMDEQFVTALAKAQLERGKAVAAIWEDLLPKIKAGAKEAKDAAEAGKGNERMRMSYNLGAMRTHDEALEREASKHSAVAKDAAAAGAGGSSAKLPPPPPAPADLPPPPAAMRESQMPPTQPSRDELPPVPELPPPAAPPPLQKTDSLLDI